MGHAKIIYKGFTCYGNACILIESVHRVPRENTNSVGKLRNSSICFFTHTRSSNDYSKLVRIINLEGRAGQVVPIFGDSGGQSLQVRTPPLHSGDCAFIPEV